MSVLWLELKYLWDCLRHRQIKKIYDYLQVRTSSLYDQKLYCSRYPEVAASGLPPALYYMETGWRLEQDPSLSFSSRKYLARNPDVLTAEICPLMHWLKNGRYEGRRGGIVGTASIPFGRRRLAWSRFLCRKQISRNRDCRILVHLHVFYPWLCGPIAGYLKCLEPYPNRKLIITYSAEVLTEQELTELRRLFPEAEFRETANRGFDIGPFFHILNQEDLSRYDLVWHLHTKSVAPNVKGRLAYGRCFKGDDWFRQLYDGALGLLNTHRNIDRLLHQPDAGMAAAAELLVSDTPERVGSVRAYGRKFGLTVPDDYQFLAGTCFVVKAAALEPVRQLNIQLEDFTLSKRFVFSLAHAAERFIPIVITGSGYRILPVRTAVRHHYPTLLWRNFRAYLSRRSVASFMKKEGISDVRTLKLDTSSGLRCRFFGGVCDGHEVFIKLSKASSVVANEIAMQRKMHDLMPDHVPCIRRWDESGRFLAMDRVSGHNLEFLFSIGLEPEEKDAIARQLREIGAVLQSSGYRHRDIRPANLMWDGSHVWLLDFQFMVELDSDGHIVNELEFLKRHPAMQVSLGNIYRAPAEEWDDLWSIERVIEVMERGEQL